MLLNIARAWHPPGGSRTAEAIGEQRTEAPSSSVPEAPVVDTTSVEEPFVPNWDGDEQGTAGTVPAWSSGQNSEWAAAAAAKDQDIQKGWSAARKEQWCRMDCIH